MTRTATQTRTCRCCKSTGKEVWSFLGKPYDWTCKVCRGSGSEPVRERRA